MASLPTECLLRVTVPYANATQLTAIATLRSRFNVTWLYTIWPYNRSKNKYIVIASDLE